MYPVLILTQKITMLVLKKIEGILNVLLYKLNNAMYNMAYIILAGI